MMSGFRQILIEAGFFLLLSFAAYVFTFLDRLFRAREPGWAVERFLPDIEARRRRES